MSTLPTPPGDRPLTRVEARRLTDEVREDAATLWGKLLRLYEGGAHTALGYASWGAYFEAEFGQSRSRGYQLLGAARVVASLPAPEVQSTVVDLTESHARELERVPEDQRAGVWRAAVMLANGEGRPVAARHIRAVLPTPTRTLPPGFTPPSSPSPGVDQEPEVVPADVALRGGLSLVPDPPAATPPPPAPPITAEQIREALTDPEVARAVVQDDDAVLAMNAAMVDQARRQSVPANDRLRAALPKVADDHAFLRMGHALTKAARLIREEIPEFKKAALEEPQVTFVAERVERVRQALDWVESPSVGFDQSLAQILEAEPPDALEPPADL
ncbi:MAG: hypothetical protein QOD86_2750 [Miltoncostaeaceae bacterium]|nr:hypothetical protein [Miltoncostaeaceae bacterium]